MRSALDRWHHTLRPSPPEIQSPTGWSLYVFPSGLPTAIEVRNANRVVWPTGQSQTHPVAGSFRGWWEIREDSPLNVHLRVLPINGWRSDRPPAPRSLEMPLAALHPPHPQTTLPTVPVVYSAHSPYSSKMKLFHIKLRSSFLLAPGTCVPTHSGAAKSPLMSASRKAIRRSALD